MSSKAQPIVTGGNDHIKNLGAVTQGSRKMILRHLHIAGM